MQRRWSPGSHHQQMSNCKVSYCLSFSNGIIDLPEFKKKQKKENEGDEEDSKNKRKTILERENVFRKPYEKE